MKKIEILSKKLEQVGVKYLGLPSPERKALLDAMEEYAGEKIPLIQRFNKRSGPNKTNTGLEMVVLERIEMLKKHGKTVEFDVKHNDMGELKQAAIACLTRSADFPVHWDNTGTDHIRFDKPEIERLAVAAAFCVAEIDRLLNK